MYSYYNYTLNVDLDIVVKTGQTGALVTSESTHVRA